MTVDGLKSSGRKVQGKPVGALAREAIRWAQEALQMDNHSVIGQKKDETTEESAVGDDAMLACCLYYSIPYQLMSRFFQTKKDVPVTLLTNDNNLAIKAESNGIVALSSTGPNGEPASADLLLRQALHGPLALDKTFRRPKEGTDTCMLDLSGAMEDNLKFLPGLKDSRHAPKSFKPNRPDIAIDPQTGAVILVKEGERRPRTVRKEALAKYNNLRIEDGDEGIQESNGVKGATYADIMASANDLELEIDEMDWE